MTPQVRQAKQRSACAGANLDWEHLLRSIAPLALACCLVVLDGASARSQALLPNRQSLTIAVGTPVGGGYDAYARLLGRHLGAMLPGRPPIVVQNMPGAASLIAANWLANAAPKDGTAIGFVPNATVFEALLGNRAARFDASRLAMLGSLNDFTSIALVWHDTAFSSADDFFTHEIVVGASAAGSNNSVMPNLLNALLHTKFKVVNGYPGSGGIALALERGEVQAMVGDGYDFLKATKGQWLREKKVRILMQATLKRHEELPDVPTALERVSAENRDVLALLLARQTYAGLLVAPPDTAPSMVAQLREGFDKMIDDRDFRRDAEENHLALHPARADEVTATLGKLLASPRQVIERASAELRRIVAN